MDEKIVRICNEIFEKKNTVVVDYEKKVRYTELTGMAA